MHQESYIKEVLCRFRMEDVNAVAVPDQYHQMYTKCADVHKNGHQEALNVPYQVIGSLMYLSIGTRPDHLFCEQRLPISGKSDEDTLECMQEDPQVFEGNHRSWILLPCRSEESSSSILRCRLEDMKTRKSTIGLIMKLGESTIAWSSSKQKIVALSTTEAEYVAASQAVKEIIWVKSLLTDLALFSNLKTTLNIDNISAILKLNIKNPEFHQRSKHIDVRYHFIRDKYKEKKFILEHVSSKD